MNEDIVAIVECGSYNQDEVDNAVGKALGLLNFKLKKRAKVLIKPNVLSPSKPEEAITTHPAVVEGICKILSQYDAEIFIGDSSEYSNALSFEVSGIGNVAKKYGHLVVFDSAKITKIKDNNAKILKEFYIPQVVKDADIIINVAKLKTHLLTKFTGCIKNLLGCIPGGIKSGYHKRAPGEEQFSTLLVDIFQNIKPQLNIIDGIIGMEGQGPSAGTLKKTGLIFAGTNAVAVDIVASRVIGFEPSEIITNREAVSRGLCNPIIKVIGKEEKIPYKRPGIEIPSRFEWLYKIVPEKKIVLNKKKCSKCSLCKEHCPVNAIEVKPYPIIKKKKCIRCFCCIEICPNHAYSLQDPIGRKMFNILSFIYLNSVKKLLIS